MSQSQGNAHVPLLQQQKTVEEVGEFIQMIYYCKIENYGVTSIPLDP